MLEGARVGRDGLLLRLGEREPAQLVFERDQEQHRHRTPQRPAQAYFAYKKTPCTGVPRLKENALHRGTSPIRKRVRERPLVLESDQEQHRYCSPQRPAVEVCNLSTSLKCAAVPRRARIQGP